MSVQKLNSRAAYWRAFLLAFVLGASAAKAGESVDSLKAQQNQLEAAKNVRDSISTSIQALQAAKAGVQSDFKLSFQEKSARLAQIESEIAKKKSRLQPVIENIKQLQRITGTGASSPAQAGTADPFSAYARMRPRSEPQAPGSRAKAYERFEEHPFAHLRSQAQARTWESQFKSAGPSEDPYQKRNFEQARKAYEAMRAQAETDSTRSDSTADANSAKTGWSTGLKSFFAKFRGESREAASRELKQGDRVIVFNQRGQIIEHSRIWMIEASDVILQRRPGEPRYVVKKTDISPEVETLGNYRIGTLLHTEDGHRTVTAVYANGLIELNRKEIWTLNDLEKISTTLTGSVHGSCFDLFR